MITETDARPGAEWRWCYNPTCGTAIKQSFVIGGVSIWVCYDTCPKDEEDKDLECDVVKPEGFCSECGREHEAVVGDMKNLNRLKDCTP
jgi:hypothetical protein